MYCITNIIPNVKNYLIYKDRIIIQSKENAILFEGKVISECGTDLEIWGDFLCYNNQQNQMVFLNLESNEFLTFTDINSLDSSPENVVKFGINNSENLVIFKLDQGVIVINELNVPYNWEMIEIRNTDSYLFWDGNSVKFYDSEKVIWEKDFSEIGTVRKVLGIGGHLLWVSYMNTDENRYKKAHLLALNVDTGERIHHLSDNLPLHEVNLGFIEDKQGIVSMWGKMSSHTKAESPFVEIDALIGEVIRNTFSQSLFDANLKIGEWKYLNGKIYFDAAYDTINSTHIGVMDYETLELEWFEEVKERKAGLRNLQVTENKIYIMDSGNQLFIYNRL